MNKKSRAGKDFEQLVARIEKTLAPQGAVVKSPDYIRDRVTNRPREVDASIRVPDGEITHLITIECRDHKKGRQDDRWIEQLITKREKIGAWRTIAVSSSGFSESAITTARYYGIELRQIDQITDSEIAQEWAAGFQLSMIVIEFGLLGIKIVDAAGNIIPFTLLSNNLGDALGVDPLNIKFLWNRNQDSPLSASDIACMTEYPQDLKEDGDPVPWFISLSSNNNEWFVVTPEGEILVSQLLVILEYTKRRVPAPIQSVMQYSTPEKPILEIIKERAQVNEHSAFIIESNVSLNKPLPNVSKRSSRPRRKPSE